MLLVLDNYEHLIENSVLTSDLLRACPNLHLLVTSREKLDVSEEWLVSIEGYVSRHDTSFFRCPILRCGPTLCKDSNFQNLTIKRTFQLTATSLPLILAKKICQFLHERL